MNEPTTMAEGLIQGLTEAVEIPAPVEVFYEVDLVAPRFSVERRSRRFFTIRLESIRATAPTPLYDANAVSALVAVMTRADNTWREFGACDTVVYPYCLGSIVDQAFRVVRGIYQNPTMSFAPSAGCENDRIYVLKMPQDDYQLRGYSWHQDVTPRIRNFPAFQTIARSNNTYVDDLLTVDLRQVEGRFTDVANGRDTPPPAGVDPLGNHHDQIRRRRQQINNLRDAREALTGEPGDVQRQVDMTSQISSYVEELERLESAVMDTQRNMAVPNLQLPPNTTIDWSGIEQLRARGELTSRVARAEAAARDQQIRDNNHASDAARYALQGTTTGRFGSVGPAFAAHDSLAEDVRLANTRERRVKAHFKNRAGWSMARDIEQATDRYTIPVTQPISARSMGENVYVNESYTRQDFQLVKTAVFTDHRRNQTREEAWYEEV